MILSKERMMMVVVLALGLMQCSCKHKSLFEYLNNNYKNKLDLRALIKSDRPVIGCVIKNNRAVLTVANKPGEMADKTYYFVVDILKKKVIYTMVSPVEFYYASRVDIKGDSLIYLNAFKSERIYITNIKSGKVNELTVSYSESIQPGSVIAFDEIVLLANSLYRSAIVNLTTGESRMLENEFITNQRAISLPLKSDINLLSGKTFGEDSICLIAFDRKGAEIWNYKIRILDNLRENVLPLNILRHGDQFVVRNSRQLLGLDVESGKLLWEKNVPPYTTSATVWNDKVLLITLTDQGMYSGGDDYPRQLGVKLIEPSNGNEILNRSYQVKGEVQFAPINNDLVISSAGSLKVLNFKGDLTIDSVINSSNSIKMKIDEITGKSYLLLDNEFLYW
jgi:outer membrane protein assembly factor BamB